MLKQKLKIKKVLLTNARIISAVVILVAGSVSTGLVAGAVSCSSASDCQNQINNLLNQNAANEQSVSSLQLQATTYQGAIDQLQNQIDALEGQILTSQGKMADLNNKIASAQAQIDHQKIVLGDAIRTMYLEGQTSTVEVLLSSDNLSNFVDQEQYHLTVQNNVKASVDTITALKQKLQTSQQQVALLLKIQQGKQNQLASARAKQDALLNNNEQQQNSLNSQIAVNESTVASLQAQVAAINALENGTASPDQRCGGGYPYCSAICAFPGGGPSCGYYDWSINGNEIDPLGYYYRNCTSYVAWKEEISSSNPIIGQLVSGLGNASDWPASAQAEGISVSYGGGARVGDAAVYPWDGGSAGHVMYVEAVSGNTIYVSQYNGDGTGQYSTATISNISGLYFVHFPRS